MNKPSIHFKNIPSESVRLTKDDREYILTKLKSEDLLVVLDVTDPSSEPIVHIEGRYNLENVIASIKEKLDDINRKD